MIVIKSINFAQDFLWGAATAAYQVEGAVAVDGRGESIWDRFSHTPRKILDGQNGDTACDHYNRYIDDVSLMKEIGLKSYRFSIAWPRIFPEGKGIVNEKGLDFYNRLVDQLLDNDIEPAVTLYHWDLPQTLQDRGGWANRDTADYFSDYAACMYKSLGDRVKIWITHNEPIVASFVGNAYGEHAPGYKDYSLAVQVSHHLLVSHAKAVQAYRQTVWGKGKIGIAHALTQTYPYTTSPEDYEAALIFDGFYNRWFLDPVFKGTYPEDMLRIYLEKFNAPIMRQEDMKLIADNNIDFLGINYYTRQIIKKASSESLLGFETVKPENVKYTQMGWEVYPEGLYDLLMRLEREYQSPHILITENGAACVDIKTSTGTLDDDDRIEYLVQHLKAVHKAIKEGVKIGGYYVWTLMDNFEWAHGFEKKFGITYTDCNTKKRLFKKSAYWYRDTIHNNGF